MKYAPRTVIQVEAPDNCIQVISQYGTKTGDRRLRRKTGWRSKRVTGTDLAIGACHLDFQELLQAVDEAADSSIELRSVCKGG